MGQRYAWIDLTAGPMAYGPHGRCSCTILNSNSVFIFTHELPPVALVSSPALLCLPSIRSGKPICPSKFRILSALILHCLNVPRSHRTIPSGNATGAGSLREAELSAAIVSLTLRRQALDAIFNSCLHSLAFCAPQTAFPRPNLY